MQPGRQLATGAGWTDTDVVSACERPLAIGIGGDAVLVVVLRSLGQYHDPIGELVLRRARFTPGNPLEGRASRSRAAWDGVESPVAVEVLI